MCNHHCKPPASLRAPNSAQMWADVGKMVTIIYFLPRRHTAIRAFSGHLHNELCTLEVSPVLRRRLDHA